MSATKNIRKENARKKAGNFSMILIDSHKELST